MFISILFLLPSLFNFYSNNHFNPILPFCLLPLCSLYSHFDSIVFHSHPHSYCVLLYFYLILLCLLVFYFYSCSPFYSYYHPIIIIYMAPLVSYPIFILLQSFNPNLRVASPKGLLYERIAPDLCGTRVFRRRRICRSCERIMSPGNPQPAETLLGQVLIPPSPGRLRK